MLQSFIKGDFIHRQPGLLYIILIEYNLTMPHPISIPIGMGVWVYVKFDIKNQFSIRFLLYSYYSQKYYDAKPRTL